MGKAGGLTDPQLILGVPRTASAEEIRAAFRRLAALHHPDRNPDDPGAVVRFKTVNAAHQVLGDPARRRAYDAGRAPPPRAAPPRATEPGPAPPPAEATDGATTDDAEARRQRAKRRRGLFWSPGTAMLLGGALTLAIQKLLALARPRLVEVDVAGAEWSIVELSPLVLAVVVASVVYVALSFFGATRRGRRRRRDGGATAIHGP